MNINSYINGAFSVGTTTVDSIIDTGLAEANYFLGIPFASRASAAKGVDTNTAEVGTVPSIVKNSLNGLRNPIDTKAGVDDNSAGPLSEVRTTVRNVRNEVRATFDGRRTEEVTAARGNGVVRAQGEVRDAVTKAANDVANALRPGKPAKAADDVGKAPTTVAKSFGDTARKVVKEVRKAAKDTRDAANERPADDE